MGLKRLNFRVWVVEPLTHPRDLPDELRVRCVIWAAKSPDKAEWLTVDKYPQYAGALFRTTLAPDDLEHVSKPSFYSEVVA